jgi:hypothetical protein
VFQRAARLFFRLDSLCLCRVQPVTRRCCVFPCTSAHANCANANACQLCSLLNALCARVAYSMAVRGLLAALTFTQHGIQDVHCSNINTIKSSTSKNVHMAGLTPLAFKSRGTSDKRRFFCTSVAIIVFFQSLALDTKKIESFFRYFLFINEKFACDIKG